MVSGSESLKADPGCDVVIFRPFSSNNQLGISLCYKNTKIQPQKIAVHWASWYAQPSDISFIFDLISAEFL